MAIDVYLQIDGIKGESQDSTHQGWIELMSAHWGVAQPKSATASTSGSLIFALAALASQVAHAAEGRGQ